MKRFILIICTVLTTYSFSNAQFSLGISGSPAFPLGNFGNVANTGFGFNADAKYAVNENILVGASIGYNQFGASLAGFNLNNVFNNIDFTIVPILASVDYLLATEDFKPYIGVDAGVYNASLDLGIFDVSQASFGLAPKLGFMYAINDQLDFNADIKYHLIYADFSVLGVDVVDNITYLPINLGIRVKFNN